MPKGRCNVTKYKHNNNGNAKSTRISRRFIKQYRKYTRNKHKEINAPKNASINGILYDKENLVNAFSGMPVYHSLKNE